MRIKIWLAALLVSVWMTTSVLAQPLTVTDMVGRTVTLQAEPQRIICIGPVALRLIFYLDAKEKVLGV